MSEPEGPAVAEEDGIYVGADGVPFRVKAGGVIPAGATPRPTAPSAEERAKGKAPEDRAKPRAPENRQAPEKGEATPS